VKALAYMAQCSHCHQLLECLSSFCMLTFFLDGGVAGTYQHYLADAVHKALNLIYLVDLAEIIYTLTVNTAGV